MNENSDQKPTNESTVNETQDKPQTTTPEPAAGDPPTAAPGAATEAKPSDAEAKPAGEQAPGATDDEEPTGEVPTVSAEEPSTAAPPAGPQAAEIGVLRAALDERTGDLQRVTAEYANYRKRVERDRLVVAEQATAQVVAALLPVLDDLDRAREHGDLVGPFATMAEQLGAALAKFGLNGFGEVGDAFDPTRHEAVTHQTSADVTVPTCVAVMRRGYTLGERLLRPALVAVADPESE